MGIRGWRRRAGHFGCAFRGRVAPAGQELTWISARGKFAGAGREISEALGWNPDAPSARDRHPFVVEILRIAPGRTPYPYHSHSAQWEFYHVISGAGLARDESGHTPIVAGSGSARGRRAR